ncbi:lipocalin family protein [Flavobacterium sp. C4GT6]|uniref:lipocalin family protein n=1 Tax=Flavobacterium sp. C4GT6 TaxID=3103818 RepID=UPI002ED3B5DF
MKNLLLTGLITITLFSCSSDDNNQPSQDKIIGSWQKTSLVVEGVNQNLSNCQLQTVYNFNASQNSFWSNIYEENFEGECTLFTEDGDWEKLSESVYTVYTESEGTVNYEVEFPNDNTLKLTYNDGSVEQPHLAVTTFVRVDL